MARILVVDDDACIVELLVDLLRSEGHDARGSAGEAAWHIAVNWRPDLILLDLMMPGLDGFTFNQRLKAEPRTRAIPIIAMSAAYNLREHGARLSVQGLMAKPFDIGELLDWVDQLTALPASADAAALAAIEGESVAVDAGR
jgi:two-component system OmpR family response regulator